MKSVRIRFENIRYTLKKGRRATRWRRWLCQCVTSWKVAGSIPVGVTEFFIDIILPAALYGPGVESASNRNECQGYFLGRGVKVASALG